MSFKAGDAQLGSKALNQAAKAIPTADWNEVRMELMGRQ